MKFTKTYYIVSKRFNQIKIVFVIVSISVYPNITVRRLTAIEITF